MAASSPHRTDRPQYAHFRRNRQTKALSSSAASVLLGLWLAASPWVLDYTFDIAAWNAIGTGAVVTLIAFARVSRGGRPPALYLLGALIGGWLFASAFWIESTTAAAWNAALVGALLIALGLRGLLAARDTEDRPWSGLR